MNDIQLNYEIYFNPWAIHDYKYILVKVETSTSGVRKSEICRCENYEKALMNLIDLDVNVTEPTWGIKVHNI